MRISKRYAVRRDSIATDMARYLLARRGDYGGAEVRDRWHAAGVASYRGYIGDARTVLALLTPEQRAVAKTKPALLGFVNVAQITDADVPTVFRFAMTSLP